MITLLKKGILPNSEGVNHTFLNTLKIGLLIEEEENATINPI